MIEGRVGREGCLSFGKDAKEQGWRGGKGGVKDGKECRKRRRRKFMIEGRGG